MLHAKEGAFTRPTPGSFASAAKISYLPFKKHMPVCRLGEGSTGCFFEGNKYYLPVQGTLLASTN